MAKVELRLNGRKVTSSRQLARDLTKAIEQHAEKALRRQAGPGVTIEKIPGGFHAVGPADEVQALRRKLRD